MSVQYSAVFSLCAAEVVLVLLFVALPLQWLRKTVVPALRLLWGNSIGRVVFYVCVTMLAFMLFDSAQQFKKYSPIADLPASDRQGFSYHNNQLQLFRAERNAYLTFFTLLLAVVLSRLYAFVEPLTRAEEADRREAEMTAALQREQSRAQDLVAQLQALKTQAEHQQAEYAALDNTARRRAGPGSAAAAQQ